MKLCIQGLTRSVLLLVVVAVSACGGGTEPSASPVVPSLKANVPSPAKKASTVTGGNAIAIHMYQALYGMAPSNALLLDYASQANNDASLFAKTLADRFTTTSHADLAKLVLDNLGVTPTTVPAINAKGESEYALLLDAVKQIFGAFPTMRGQVILNMTDLLTGLESDSTYGAAALGYNNQTVANFGHSTDPAHTVAAAVAPSLVVLTIQTTVPPNTPPGDAIWMRTGMTFAVSQQDVAMNKVSSAGNVWQASVLAPEGTILRYFFRRNADFNKKETAPLRSLGGVFHQALVRKNATVKDAVGQWEDFPLASGAIGTLTGIVKSSSGEPLIGIRVGAGPHEATTRWDGTYRILGVPSETREITFRADNGEYVSARASVTVSPGATASANMTMAAAAMANVTFLVTIPEGTPAGAVPRIYGDMFRLGMVQIEQSSSVDFVRMRDMTFVSGATWSYTTSLGVGTCANYTYTLGYNSVNNERDSSSNAIMRSLCVTGDMTVKDTVLSWKAPWHVPVALTVTSPTGSADTLYVEISTAAVSGNYVTTKMWSTGAGTARYVIYSEPNTDVKYRYVRNADAGPGVEIVPPADQDPPLFRIVNSGATGTITNDSIHAWRFQMLETPLTTVSTGLTEAVPSRAAGSFQTGVEFIDYWRGFWGPLVRPSVARLKSKNVQWVQIASVWEITNMDNPVAEQGGNSFATEDLLDHIREIKTQGLKVALRAFPYAGGAEAAAFSVPHDNAWYDLFFDATMASYMYHAKIAQQEGVDLLMLANYNWVDDGGPTASATRAHINTRWKGVIAAVRTIAPSVKLTTDNYTDAPEYDWYGDLDYLGAKWWEPLATTDKAPVAEMYATATNTLTTRFKPISERFGNKPFIFSEVAYYSANTSAMQHYQVFSPEISDFTAAVAASTSDYDEQARAYQATLMAFANTPWVQGCYSFGYAYFDFDSKGYSIRGKTAEEIMSQIYRQLNGP